MVLIVSVRILGSGVRDPESALGSGCRTETAKMTGDVGPRDRLLVARLQVLDRDLAAGTLVAADDRDERRRARRRT